MFEVPINVPSTAVIQVKQGIGDVIWHLPFIRAIAAATGEGAVSFLTLPSTHARELLAAEPCVAEVVYFEHNGSEVQRAFHLASLVQRLRARNFKRAWILDRTTRPAIATKLAGIPERIGLGLGPQRWFITNAGIDARHFHDMPIEWLRALMATMKVPLASTEPDLKLPQALRDGIAARYAAHRHPWAALALGGSHPAKDWPDDHWVTFLDTLRRRSGGTVFLIGGPDNVARADALIARTAGAPVVNACGLSIGEAAALLRLADLFVGPDSGPMNLAVAGATPAFVLFGSTPVLDYSRFIHAIEPDDGFGRSSNGMARISPAAVMRRVEPYLDVVKAAP
jgi:heptosyltransferase-2